MNARIILIGFMGSGKTWMGKKIAEELGLTFIDLDDYIESSSGMSVNEIFMHGGESYFRKLERRAVNMLHNEKVISTGAGCIESHLNRSWLEQQDNLIIWLNPPWETIWQRIKESARPKVRSLNEEEVKELWQERKELYEKCADIVYEKEDPQELLNIIEQKFKES